MITNLHLRIFILVVLFPIVNARADFGWMPKYQTMFLTAGTGYFSSSKNFADDGVKDPILFKNNAVQLNEYRFYIEPEYGFAQDWAGRVRFNFFSGEVGLRNGQGTALDGGGVGDIQFGIKYRLVHGDFNLTSDVTIKTPTYSTILNDEKTLLPGDGNVDLGLALHLGYRKDYFLLNATPQLLLRTGGYSQAFDFRVAAGASGKPGYILVVADFLLSMGTTLLFDSSFVSHDAAGTGGSYAKLSGSPNGFTLGAKAGVKFTEKVFLEANFRQAIWGKRFPNFFEAGLNLFFRFDFYKPDTRQKIKAIPFDSEPETDPSGNPA